jgi:hypothetical protein
MEGEVGEENAAVDEINYSCLQLSGNISTNSVSIRATPLILIQLKFFVLI